MIEHNYVHSNDICIKLSSATFPMNTSITEKIFGSVSPLVRIIFPWLVIAGIV